MNWGPLKFVVKKVETFCFRGYNFLKNYVVNQTHWSKTIIIEVDTCGYGRGAGGRSWMWLDTPKS